MKRCISSGHMGQLAQAKPRTIQHSKPAFGHRRASAGVRASRFLGPSCNSLVILYMGRYAHTHCCLTSTRSQSTSVPSQVKRKNFCCIRDMRYPSAGCGDAVNQFYTGFCLPRMNDNELGYLWSLEEVDSRPFHGIDAMRVLMRSSTAQEFSLPRMFVCALLHRRCRLG